MKKKIHKNSFDGFLKYKNLGKFYQLTGRKKHSQTVRNNTSKFKRLIQKKSNQEFRTCQVCSSKSNNILFNKGGFIHVRCNACSFVYVNPILKPEAAIKKFK